MTRHTFTVRYSEALVRKGVRRHYASVLRREVNAALYVALCLLICLLVYDFSRGRVSWVDGAAGTVIVLAPAILFYTYSAHVGQALARLRQMAQPTATFDANTESLTVTTDMGSSTFPWRRFKGIIRADNFWVLLLGQNASLTLPTDSVDPTALKFIQEQVSSGAAV
jgi:hypothetical protein